MSALLEARSKAEKAFDLVRSYVWPVDPPFWVDGRGEVFTQPEEDPMLEGLKPLRAADLDEDDRRRAALEEFERDQEARQVPEFKPLVILRDPQNEDEG